MGELTSLANSYKPKVVINFILNLSEYVGYSHCLLMGDFNFLNVNWITSTSLEAASFLNVRNMSPNQLDTDMAKVFPC